MTSAKARIYFTSGAIIMVLASALIFSLFTITRLQDNLKIQVHTRTVLLTLKENINFLLYAEAAESEFVLTGDTTYYERYHSALQNIKANTAQLDTLTTDNPFQQQKLDTLKKLINRKISLSNQLITLAKQGDEAALKSTLISLKSKYLMEGIRALNTSMQEVEKKLFAERQSATGKSIADAKKYFIIGFILSLLTTVLLMLALKRELAKRTKAEARINKINQELETKNSDLESKTNFIRENEKRIVGIIDTLLKTTQLDFSEKLSVSDRGDELDAIAVGLNTMSEELEFHLQQLKESEEKLNDAQRLAKIGSWTMDFATKNVKWSEEMFNIYGFGQERFAVTFDKAIARVLPEDAELTQTRMRKNVENALNLFRTQGIREYEIPPAAFTIMLNEGNTKVVQGRGKIILDSNGELLKMVGTVQDIDEQYKAQQKLNEYNIELERRNKEIKQFAYAASHDLQEPLRSISNFSKLLADRLAEYPDKEMNEYMSLVINGASRMSKLIFSLLEYSRIGKDMQKRATDCDKLVQEILIDLAAIVEESGASIHVDKLPTIQSYDLKSVFQNLIINAIKFRRKDIQSVVNISATDLGKEFLFIIKDNGIGIEKEYYDRIFVIFQRLHLRTEYEGTGIGLSLTRKIIEMHGGKIWVESAVGKGTTFYFTIPKS